MTTNEQQIALAKVLANHLQIRGRVGGWLYDRTGKAVCQGWDAFWLLAVRRGWVRPYAAGTWISRSVTVSGWRIDWRKVG